MTGHVFHPGHSELHGVTGVVETKGPLTYVGRYDSQDERGVHMLDVGVHDGAEGGSKDEYVSKSARFGVRTVHKHLVVPVEQVVSITPLGSLM
jgi:hypothetical protein